MPATMIPKAFCKLVWWNIVPLTQGEVDLWLGPALLLDGIAMNNEKCYAHTVERVDELQRNSVDGGKIGA